MTTHASRQMLPIDPATLLERLPDMGKLMIFTTNSHVTHERIGAVEQVSQDNGWLHFHGKAHDSQIRVGAIRSITVDRSRRMADKIYPRIELNHDDGEIACIVGFEGLDPFDRVLQAFPAGKVLEPRETIFNTMPESKPVDTEDPGILPFELARRDYSPTTVELTTSDFRQQWKGLVPDLKMSLGFINILQPDFHLHVRGGSIANWDVSRCGSDRRFEARCHKGETVGFSVTLAV